jgi:4-hydroxy-3-methylbut-2-enyl diphosphate reductase
MASSAATVSASATYAGASLTRRRASARASRASRFVVRAAEDAKADEPFDARAFRRELSKMPTYNRKFAKDEESAEAMESAGIGMVSKGACRGRASRIVPDLARRSPQRSDYATLARARRRPLRTPSERDRAPERASRSPRALIPPTLARARRPRVVLPDLRSRPSSSSPPDLPRLLLLSGGLVAQMRAEGFEHVKGDVTVKLADAYGFCWGVERAVQMAYEARKQYPDSNLWITNEIIHNPTVNKRLADMGVQFIQETPDGKDFSGVKEGEVVILPAFGASVHEMKLLVDKGVGIVDTTCPWVSKVWNAVDAHKRKEFTSIIHGKWAHEETVATASFAGTYLIVKDLAEAEYVCDYILNGGDKDAFMAKFENAHSAGFDPEKDLEGVGIANQTTMLKGETQVIGKLLEKTMMSKYGVTELDDHYKNAGDTICDATQERQDAMYKLVEDKPDIIVVIGGFNSSNTQHLQEISEEAGITSYWVDTPDRLTTDNVITWRTAHGELVTTENWLPEGKLTISVTSGASTPDKVVEDVLDVIFATKEGAAKEAVAA